MSKVQHVSTVTVDPATGQPTYHQDIQGGPATTSAYDSVGRVLTMRTAGTQPVEQRLSACTASANCLVRRQSFQAGAPIKTEYMDLLGRVVATGAEGFDGLEIVTKVAYNEPGLKVAEYAPWKSSVLPGQWDGSSRSPFVTQYSRIDALARVGTKTVLRASAGLFESGRGEATLTTTYTYVPVDIGLRTDIAVSKPASQGGTLTMSRTYDRAGKLVATTQSTSPTHSIPANYFYDPAGNLLTIVDANGNKLVATYDDLGRKKRVDDPDRGTWTYAWDGIGRLESQTDARSIVVSHGYDGIGRLVQRFVKTPTDTVPVLEATWQYDLNGKLGVLGALVGADGFRRDYLYDPLLRPFNVKTTVPGSADWTAQTFTEQYGYDHNYGRVKAMSYPSNEFAALDYDSRGNLRGENAVAADGSRGTTYRHVRGMSVRGQVTVQDLANGITETAQYDDSTGMALELSATGLRETPPTNCPTATAPLVRQVDYTYDHFLNLAKQVKQFHLRAGGTGAIQFSSTCQPLGGAATEAYQYDDLQRLLGSSRFWTGMTPGPGTTSGESYAYDDLGNIITKSDYAQQYNYGTNRITGAAGPHAVVSVSTGATFTYDPNGNLTQGDGRTVSFDSLDRPIAVTMGTVTTQFRYAPDGARYLQRTTGAAVSPTAKTVYYVDKDYERIAWSSGAVEEKTYIGPSVVIERNGATRDVRYLHPDRLNSTDAMTNASAFEVTSDAHGFDAFGKPRGRDWQPSGDKLHPCGYYGATTEHGFTGHEHLDDTYLIHMNGRVYDYRLGRFLSVDPIISNPANSQSINPYSYIGNNPLSGVDPTGYEAIQGCTSSTEGVCLGAGFMQSAKFNAAEVTWVNPNVSHDSGESQRASASAKTSQSGAEPQAAQLCAGNPTSKASPGEVANVDGGSSYPVGARVAWGWLVGGLEFRKGVDAFTGDALSWPQRVLSLVGTLGMLLPPLSEAIAESRAVAPVLAAESRAPSVVQAVQSAQQPVKALSAEGGGAASTEAAATVRASQIDRAAFRVQRETFWKTEAQTNQIGRAHV